MNKILNILFLTLPLLGISQTDTIAHLYTFGGNNNDIAEEIQATSDGGYIVIGSTSSNSWGNTDGYLLKVDSMCNYEWSQALGGSNNDWGYSIKQTFDKGFIIALSTNSFGNGGYDACLMKRDSLGNYEWRKTYGGNDWDFAYSVVQTYDSGYVFCGETYNNTNGYSDVYIVKTNPLGDTLWTRTIGGALIDKGNSIIETSDSNIVVAGSFNTISDSTDAYVIKLSSNGTLLWDSIYGDTLYESANSIIETSNGNYVISGTSNSFSLVKDKDFHLSRIDNNGSLIWDKNFGSLGNEEAFDVYEESNGDLINIGFTEAFGGGMKDGILFLITSNGNWGGLGPTYGDNNDEALNSIAIGINGDYCMAGYSKSYGNGLDDVLLVRLDTVYLGQDTNVTSYFDNTPLHIKELNSTLNVSIYPNPTSSFINIQIDNFEKGNLFNFVIQDLNGRIVEQYILNSCITSVQLTGLNEGFYLYTISDRVNKFQYGKLVIY